MRKSSAFVGVIVLLLLSVASQAQMQIYGAWHCGSDFCTWASVRNMTDFDTKNHWMIDRGDGSGLAFRLPEHPLDVAGKRRLTRDRNRRKCQLDELVQLAGHRGQQDQRLGHGEWRADRNEFSCRKLFYQSQCARHAFHRRHYLHQLLGPGALY